MVQLMGNWKKVEMWPLQRGSRLAKVARIRHWKKNLVQEGPIYFSWKSPCDQRSRKQKGGGQTSEIQTLQKGRSRRRWDSWRIFAAFLETFEAKFTHCVFWPRVRSWKSLDASRHSCCYREALHRRNGRSSPANNHIDLLAARRLLLKPGLMTVLKVLEIYRPHRLGTLGRHPQTAFSQEDADFLLN